jgi:Zn-dependent protease/CBS domain-containing protein
MFSNAVKLFDIFGFQIRVDPSWLIIAALIVWSLATGYFPELAPELSRADAFALSIVAMLGLFGCLILHELAHSLVARRFGLGVGGITLFLFGGVAELEKEPESARSEFWIAIAGPAMSFALAAVSWLAMGMAATAGASHGLIALFEYLAGINLILALFNLLPAFPLDGGRVLRALLWRSKGDVLQATRLASLSGTAFGYAFVALGLFSLFSGGSIIGSLWPILIGLFLASAARGTYQQMLMRRSMKGRTVGELVTNKPLVVAPERTVRDLVDDVMLGHGVGFVPVLEHGRAIGFVDTATVRGVDRENWDTVRVEDIYIPLSDTARAAPAEPLESLLRRIAATGQRKFIVEDQGRFIGVITLSDLVAHINVMQELSAGTSGRSPIGV